jgi:Tol biopolymer transport system component
MNADGSRLRRPTTAAAPASAPAWSPDGSKMAVISNRDGNDEIDVMNADESGQTRLTTDPLPDCTPAWQATAP